jgi:hypothetical protein
MPLPTPMPMQDTLAQIALLPTEVARSDERTRLEFDTFDWDGSATMPAAQLEALLRDRALYLEHAELLELRQRLGVSVGNGSVGGADGAGGAGGGTTTSDGGRDNGSTSSGTSDGSNSNSSSSSSGGNAEAVIYFEDYKAWRWDFRQFGHDFTVADVFTAGTGAPAGYFPAGVNAGFRLLAKQLRRWERTAALRREQARDDAAGVAGQRMARCYVVRRFAHFNKRNLRRRFRSLAEENRPPMACPKCLEPFTSAYRLRCHQAQRCARADPNRRLPGEPTPAWPRPPPRQQRQQHGGDDDDDDYDGAEHDEAAGGGRGRRRKSRRRRVGAEEEVEEEEEQPRDLVRMIEALHPEISEAGEVVKEMRRREKYDPRVEAREVAEAAAVAGERAAVYFRDSHWGRLQVCCR